MGMIFTLKPLSGQAVLTHPVARDAILGPIWLILIRMFAISGLAQSSRQGQQGSKEDEPGYEKCEKAVGGGRTIPAPGIQVSKLQ